jgi:hypothetical protein
MHLRTHAWAGAGAVRKDEIGDPDVAIESGSGEGTAFLIGKFEARHFAQNGQGLFPSAGGEQQNGKNGAAHQKDGRSKTINP